MFYTFATQECVYNNLYRCIVTGRWWRNIQRWDGSEDSAVGSPGGFGDTILFFHLYLTLTHRWPTFTADMITYYCPNMKEPLRPTTTGPLNAGISIGQIDLHKQAATTSRQIIAKISKRITANF